MRLGYKVFGLQVTPIREFTPLTLDDSAFGDDGARGLLTETLREAIGAEKGQKDEKRRQFTRFDRLTTSNWAIALKVSGGPFGELAEVYNFEGKVRVPIEPSDALLSPTRLIFVVPPDGVTALLITEIHGRRNPTPQVINRLNEKLKPTGLCIRTVRDIVDGLAWHNYLQQDNVAVKGVELVQLGGRAGRAFATSDTVTKARLSLSFRQGAAARYQVLAALAGRTQRDSLRKLKLAGLVGLSVVSDDDFDEETLVIVADKQERKIRVTHGWPEFTYSLPPDQLSMEDLLAEVKQTATDDLRALDVELPSVGWWPNPNELSPADPAEAPD